jgi:hypothetical protein
VNNISKVAAALILPALWWAPNANADTQFNGEFWPLPNGAGRIPAHYHAFGNGGDPSRPTGTITNSDGCTIDVFQRDQTDYFVDNQGSESGFVTGQVTSGGGPNCQSSTRLNMTEFKNKVSGEYDFNIFDLDNNHTWFLKGSAP